MQKDTLQALLDKDNLKGAIDTLLAEQSSKSLKLLKGRLTELERQNNQGIIGLEAYNLEKNKIRAALLDIVEHGDQEAPSVGGNKVGLFATVGILLLVALGLVYFVGMGRSKKAKRDIPEMAASTESNGPTAEKAAEEKPIDVSAETPVKKPEVKPVAPRKKYAEIVSAALGSDDFAFKLSPVGLSETKEYRQALAYLKRRYTWETDLAFVVENEDMKVEQGDNAQSAKIRIRSVKVAPDLYIRNRQASTVQNSLWIEETSKDGEFWQNVDYYTRTNINKRLKANPGQKSLIKDRVEDLIKKKLKNTDQGQLSFEIQKLELYNGEVLQYWTYNQIT